MSKATHSTGEISPQQIADMLDRTGSLAQLTESERARIVDASPIERAAPGQIIIEQGDIGDFAYLVLDGKVRVEVETDAGKVPVATLAAGSLVGEIAAFSPSHRTASIVAATQTTLLKIEQVTIRQLLSESPETSMAIVAELGSRLQGLNGAIATLTQATKALAIGEFEPDMLEVLRREAGRIGQFADVFEEMAQEIQNKRLLTQEMNTAAQIQQALLPRRLEAGAHAERFELTASMTAAKDVGGDFYDYFMIDEDTLGFAVGDVSGKGVPAAIFMSVSRTALRTVARQSTSASDTLSRVNAFLADGNREAMFVTLVFGRLNLRTGEMSLAAGGHEDVFVLFGDGRLDQPLPTGPALGLLATAPFTEHVFTLKNATTLILATDGITEAFNADGGMYGVSRLQALLSGAAGQTAATLGQNIEADVAEFVGDHPQSDDLTFLVLRYLP